MYTYALLTSPGCTLTELWSHLSAREDLEISEVDEKTKSFLWDQVSQCACVSTYLLPGNKKAPPTLETLQVLPQSKYVGLSSPRLPSYRSLIPRRSGSCLRLPTSTKLSARVRNLSEERVTAMASGVHCHLRSVNFPQMKER